MSEFISFLEERILTDIYDFIKNTENIQGNDKILIYKRFLENVFVVEFKHPTDNLVKYTKNLDDLIYSLKSFGCTSVIVGQNEDTTYITIIPPIKK
ncbi:MAG: hypothetical protein ACOYO1_19885 [Bacteroidales bacterium]